MEKKQFYNTINLHGEALKKANDQNAFQEIIITAIFKDNPDLSLSPSMVHDIFNTTLNKSVPITSIRRGMTNLTKGNPQKGVDGVLTKTEMMLPGPYGYPEHFWQLKSGSSREKEHIYKNGEQTAGDIAAKMLTNSNSK